MTVSKDGESKLTHVADLLSKCVAQSGEPGRRQLTKEVDGLRTDWKRTTAVVADTKHELEAKLEAWNEFDRLQEELSRWMRDIEPRVKGQDLKASVDDKKSLSANFKVGSHRQCKHYCIVFICSCISKSIV